MRIWRSEGVRGFSLTLSCLFCVLVPLFAGIGPVNTRGGGDSPFLLVRLEQLLSALRAGALPARWMPDAAYGLGYPFFAFYAALPYYLAAGFRLLGWGPILSLQVTQALGLALSAAAMALLANRLFRGPAAVTLAAVAYTCAPFHLVNVYVRGDSLSEFYAFVFYPLIFWALLHLRDAPTLPNVAYLALSYGGLILTHNLSAVMFSAFVAPYALFLLLAPRPADAAQPKHTRTRLLLLMLGGGILGLALSATLWLSVMDDLGAVWMGAKDIQTTGFFNYAGHFRSRDLIQTSLAFSYGIGPSQTPFALGLVQAGLIVLGMVTVVIGWLEPKGTRSLAKAPSNAFWLMGLLLGVYLITPLSRPLWANLPVLPLIQFPWRFLSVVAFFGALVIGELGEQLPRPWWVTVGATVLLLGGAVGSLRPEYLPIGETDVTAERLSLFESFTTNIGTTIRGEYLPLAVEPRPYASADTLMGQRRAPVALTGELERAELVGRDARSERWQVSVRSEVALLAFDTLYFPGWTARMDGTPLNLEPLPSSGRISLRVPQGTHAVDLRLGRTAWRWASDLVSLVAFLSVIALLVPQLRPLGAVPLRRTARVVGVALAVAGLVIGVGWAITVARERWPDDDLSMDFDRMPFLHHNPQGIDFGDTRLERYSCAEGVPGGGTLAVTLHWSSPAPDLRTRLSLVVPSSMHPDLAPFPAPLAQVESSVDAPTTLHELAVPEDAASGVYYIAVHVFHGQNEIKAVTARGHTLGTTYLRPVRVSNSRPARESDPVLARFGDRILLRDDVRVVPDSAGWDVQTTWQAVRPIAANYTCLLQVLRADGTILAQRDYEGGPGYGFWPTSAWPVGEWLTDRLRIPLPEDNTADEAAALRVVLYDRSTADLRALGSAVVPLAERDHSYDVPEMDHAVSALFGEQAELLGYDVVRDGQALRLVLHWRAVRQALGDWTVFVHLLHRDGEQIATQWDEKPLRGAYPMSWWREGEVVSDETVLDLRSVPTGEYLLAVGLYDAETLDRLPVVVESGGTLEDGRFVLAQPVSIRGSP